MTGALQYEWVRIRTIASSYWMSAIAIVLSAGLSLLVALTANASDFEDLNIVQFTTWVLTSGGSFGGIPVLSAAFFAVMGAMSVGHEYRYGTNKATLTALPDRIAVLVAKALVLIAWVTASVALLVLINTAIAGLFMNDPNFGSDMVRPLVNFWGYSVGFALAGLGLAAILRNQTGAIVSVLVWPFVVEPILYAVCSAIGEASNAGIGKVTNVLPASAGRRSMFDPYDALAGYFGSVDTWGIVASVIVFWVGVAALVIGGSSLFVARDA